MASNINPSKPEAGSAKTADVRANFAAAKSEIEALQDAVAGKQASSALLAAIAALDSSNGVVVQTGSGAVSKRAIGVAAATDIPDRAAADGRYAALSGAVFVGRVSSTIGSIAGFYTPWSAIGSATAGAANGAGYLGSNLHWNGSNWVASVSHASIGARGIVFNYPSFGDFRYVDAPGATVANEVVAATFHTIWHSGNVAITAFAKTILDDPNAATALATLGAAAAGHTHTAAADIYAAVKLILAQGSNVTVTANDAAKTLTVASTGGSGAVGGLFAGTVSKSANYAVVASDARYLIECTTALTLSLAAAATLGSGFTVAVWNSGTGTVVVDPAGSETINDATTLTLQAGQWALITCTGTAWKAPTQPGQSSSAWSPTDKEAALVVSANGLTASVAAGGAMQSGRGTKALSGKRYFEIILDVKAASGPSAFVGIATLAATFSYDYGIGESAGGYAYADDTGRLLHARTETVFGATWNAAGVVIGVAYDDVSTPGSVKIWFSRNGVWQGGGDPATGASPAFTIASATFYPAITCKNGGQITARFSAAFWTYAAPSGFSQIP